MSNMVKRSATRALDGALFAVGLVESAARLAADRLGRHRSPEARWVPPQRGAAAMTGTPEEAPPAATPDAAGQEAEDVGVVTPVGTTGAAPAYNPSTAEADLQQPGTEQIMEPSTTKRIKSETDMLRRAAQRNPGDE